MTFLRQSNATPNVSAYAHLGKLFDYNKMPLAPMRCAVKVHKKTDKRGTWTFHSVDAWYLVTSPEYYRTHSCHVKKTKSKRFTDTAQINHICITNATITHTDNIMGATTECAQAIKGMSNAGGSKKMKQLQRLATQAVMEDTGVVDKELHAPVPAINGEAK